jgi:hypothetical protein
MDGLRFTYRRYARANAVFENREGWYTPLGQTHRLLVGPFDSNADAQAFINALAEGGVESLRWRSEEGQEISRLYEPGRSPQPTADARRPGDPPAEAAAPAAPSHPARFWAQVAIGQQIEALRFTYRQFSRRAPNAFADRTAWYTPLNATNRLLVGPFDSRAEAQAFLNAAREEGEVDGYIFHSSDGQEVTRLDSR